MVDKIEEGETYTSLEYNEDILVLGIGSESDEKYVLAVLWVERETKETRSGGELTILKKDLKNWSVVEL